MEIIRVKLTELKPYGKNPRKNDEAAKAVAKSIEQCGYVAPIIVDENMEILAGHTRLKALTLLKYTEVDCLVKRGCPRHRNGNTGSLIIRQMNSPNGICLYWRMSWRT